MTNGCNISCRRIREGVDGRCLGTCWFLFTGSTHWTFQTLCPSTSALEDGVQQLSPSEPHPSIHYLHCLSRAGSRVLLKPKSPVRAVTLASARWLMCLSLPASCLLTGTPMPELQYPRVAFNVWEQQMRFWSDSTEYNNCAACSFSCWTMNVDKSQRTPDGFLNHLITKLMKSSITFSSLFYMVQCLRSHVIVS